MWKVMLAIMLMLGALMSSAPPASAAAGRGATPPDAPPEATLALVRKLDAASARAGDAWARLTPAERNAVLLYLKPQGYLQGKQPRLVSVKYVSAPAASQGAVGAVQPYVGCWWGWYINNVRFWYNNEGYVTKVVGGGNVNGVLTLTTTRETRQTWGANVGISAGQVDAGLNYDLQKAISIAYSYQINVPRGKTGEIQAWNLFKIWKYDVWHDNRCGADSKDGWGWAEQFNGVRYYAWVY